MNGNSSQQTLFERLSLWIRTRDYRGPLAMGAVGVLVVGSLTIVGVAYAQSGGGLFGMSPESSKTPVAEDEPKDEPESTPDPDKTEKPADDKKSEPEPEKTDKPKDDEKKPEAEPTKKPKPPVTGVIAETLDQIMAAVNAYRAGKGLAPYGELGDNCEKVDYAWADALPGGRISTNIIAENPGPLGRTVAAPHWMAAYPYWYDDGKSGEIPSVKIKIYQCMVKESPSPSPSVTPSDPPSPSPDPSPSEDTE